MGEIVDVVSVTKIPRGARTSFFTLDHEQIAEQAGNAGNIVQVGIWNNGEIQPLNTSQLPSFWPKLVKISADCHVQNVRLCRLNTNNTSSQAPVVVIQAIKDIQQGQQLLLWFDDDILDEMEIPAYLTPANIRGGNVYTCHLCGRSFEAPNNLKVHIALKCGTFPLTVLWRRLLAAKPTTTTTTTPTTALLTSSSSPPSIWSPLTPSISGLSTTSTSTSPLLHILINSQHPQLQPLISIPPLSQPSAFPDVTSSAQPLQFHANGHPNGRAHHQTNRPKLKLKSSRPSHPQKRSLEKTITVSDPEAQLESIVSNMGKARNGHMCLYCGKLYSRKYGLKIHIRTHTGYKPLQCRICQRPFGDPSNLNKHIRLHSDGNTPYRCDICHKVLVRKRDLERHIRSRHTTPVLPVPIPDGLVLDCSLGGGVRTPANV